MRRVLVTGANGMLGRDISSRLRTSCELLPRNSLELDIRDREKVFSDILKNRPDAVINCAAYTNVDMCEQEQELAFAVNAEGPGNLALACSETGARLYHISTDFIFPGDKNTEYVETDPPNPISAYGKSKYEGEKKIQDTFSNYVIIRTSWLFGKWGKNFVSTIAEISQKRDSINVVDDQTGCPTYTVDLAEAIELLLNRNCTGIYHFCNSGMCTWFEFSKKIISLLGRNTGVIPITSSELGRPAARPAFSVMNCDKFTAETGLKPRPWEEALKEYLESYKGA